MSSRLGRRLFSQVIRPSVRVTGRNAGIRQRLMSTAEHGEVKEGSDLPWQIGSAVVFGPAAIYLLSPSSKPKAHKEDHSHKPAKLLPVKDDEGTEVSAAEVEASVQTAYNTDSPKDAQAAEEQPSEEKPIADSDGNAISADEVKESMQQAFNEDSPKDAQSEEQKVAQSASGAAEAKPDQSSSSTSKNDSSSVDLGDAEKIVSGEASKEAKD